MAEKKTSKNSGSRLSKKEKAKFFAALTEIMEARNGGSESE